MSLVEQELLTLPEYLSSPQFLVGFVFNSIFSFMCMFVDRCLSFCTFSFDHCVVCSSSIYWFWLPLWYLQTLLILHCTGNIYLSELLSFQLVPNNASSWLVQDPTFSKISIQEKRYSVHYKATDDIFCRSSQVSNNRLHQIILFCLDPFVFLLTKTFKLFDFPIFWQWAYLMKVVQEIHHAN